jgi:hypothetical protein
MKKNEDLNKSKLEISEDKSKDKVISKLDAQTLKLQDFQKQNQTLLSKLDTQTLQIQDLKSNLEEQVKLNGELCKRLFELKN